MHLSWEKVFVEVFFPIKLEKVTSFFCMCVTFWYIALPSLHDYNMKLPNATFYGGTLKTQQQIFLPLSKVWIISVPKNSAPGKLKFAFTACKESHVWQPGASGFCYRLVIFVLNLPDGQVFVFGNSNYRRTVINPADQKGFGASWNDFWASIC